MRIGYKSPPHIAMWSGLFAWHDAEYGVFSGRRQPKDGGDNRSIDVYTPNSDFSLAYMTSLGAFRPVQSS